VRRVRIALVLVLAAVAVLVSGEPATSSFQGRNGHIAVPLNGSIRLIDPSRPFRPPGRIASATAFLGHARYSPDGERIAYERAGRASTTYIARSDGSGPRKLVKGGGLAWSPDGSRIAYLSGGGLFVSDSDGRHARSVLDAAEVDVVDWSPLGDRLVLAMSPNDRSGIYTMRPDGRGLLLVYAPPAGSQAWWPTWSPDGQRIAFTEAEGCRANVCGGRQWITLMQPDGAGKQRIAEGGSFATWSPDGRFLAYQEAGGGLRVVIRSVATGGSRTLTVLGDEGLSERLDWQPRCTLRGGRGPDHLRGGSRANLVCGLRGPDVISGGAGSDRLFGEAGNDRILARDGTFDVVGCGPGRDSVVADGGDLVGRDCEHVVRASR